MRSHREVDAINSRIILAVFGEIDGNRDRSIAMEGQGCLKYIKKSSLGHAIMQKSLLICVKFPSFLIVQHRYFLFFDLDKQYQSK